MYGYSLNNEAIFSGYVLIHDILHIMTGLGERMKYHSIFTILYNTVPQLQYFNTIAVLLVI